MVKDNESRGSEHTNNARPSTKNKHEAGAARKSLDRGGERGDRNRGYPRLKPRNWRGPWPPLTFGVHMHTVAIQIASQSDAAESIAKLVEEWALDSATVHAVNFHPGTSDDWYFWNITFAVEDIRRFVRLFRPLEQYCTRRLAEIARRSKQRMQRFPHSPEQHASIVVVAAETEAEKPQWDDYMEIFNYSTESATLE
ncbi:MAG TPA: hypothetical protein VHC91_20430 [Trinickia sp.]|uniref:hypothetical protein n=1 Tax=Trinickia sp. TaxID=2571163 RepID=UPI002BF95070|nr:hypothetical protein [Trinickia sp.]HVW52728.1 hypothetical protein [Trinickia sp.]